MAISWATVDFNRLRRDIGLSASVFDDTEALDTLQEAEEKYTDKGPAAAYARVLGLQGIFADTAKQVNYRQNATSVDAGSMFDNIRAMIDYYQGRVDEEVEEASANGSVVAGKPKRKPSQVHSYPGGISR